MEGLVAKNAALPLVANVVLSLIGFRAGMISTAEIEALIGEELRGATVRVQDTTGGGDHFEALVVSSAFAGKALVERHQLVYRSLKGAMADRIHALSLRTYTPEEWAQVP